MIKTAAGRGDFVTARLCGLPNMNHIKQGNVIPGRAQNRENSKNVVVLLYTLES